MRQNLNASHIDDVERTTIEKLRSAGIRQRVKPESRIAITASRRGIDGFAALLRGIIAAVREWGPEPFLIPAMGSHGGATAEGQIRLLRALGVKPEELGADICATMGTQWLGISKSGARRT